MKMLTIDALGTKSVRRMLINPMLVESISESNGETRIDTASGQTYIVKESAEEMYTLWLLAQNPEMETAYTAGMANLKTQIEKRMKEGQEDGRA